MTLSFVFGEYAWRLSRSKPASSVFTPSESNIYGTNDDGFNTAFWRTDSRKVKVGKLIATGVMPPIMPDPVLNDEIHGLLKRGRMVLPLIVQWHKYDDPRYEYITSSYKEDFARFIRSLHNCDNPTMIDNFMHGTILVTNQDVS